MFRGCFADAGTAHTYADGNGIPGADCYARGKSDTGWWHANPNGDRRTN